MQYKIFDNNILNKNDWEYNQKFWSIFSKIIFIYLFQTVYICYFESFNQHNVYLTRGICAITFTQKLVVCLPHSLSCS